MNKLLASLVLSLFLVSAHALATDVVVVTGEGKVNVTPNMAICQFGIETKNKEAVSAQRENAKIADKVISGIRKKFKLEDKDVVTTSFRVNANYEYGGSKRIFDGYLVSNNIQVRLRDAQKLGELLDYLTTNGVNLINSISFSHDKIDELMKDALKISVADARAKAEMLAKEAKRDLGKVLSLVERGASYEPPTPMMDGRMHAKMALSAAPSTPIQAGELEINSGVQMTFELK